MEIVINEWLLERLRPDFAEHNISAEQHKATRTFLAHLLQNNAITIVVRRPSEFWRKAQNYPKAFSGYPEEARFYKLLLNLLNNSDRCRLIDDEDVIALPETTERCLAQGNYVSDRYLFEAAMTTAEKRILTSDEKLIAIMRGEVFTLELPENFRF